MIDLHKAIKKGLTKPPRDYKRPVGRFYPSEAMVCPRQLYYKLTETEPDELSEMPLGLFKMGKVAEDAVFEALCDALKPRGFKVETQRRVKYLDRGITISGYTDIVLTSDMGEEYCIEIKSTVNDSNMQLTEPSKFYKGQLQTYLNVLNIENGCVLYINRADILVTNQISQTKDPEFFGQIMDKFEATLKALETSTPPPNDAEWSECKWCSYRKTCQPKSDHIGNAKKKSMGNQTYIDMFQQKLKETKK
jgi:CRISPR/Cas system-associated exonuclease Cas4 (RecB family)